ncbi:MAG: hypothetical protein VB934_12700 [Polyangiaceae bacterium]
MPQFIASMSYELSSATSAVAHKLLRAQLVGRRWQDRCKDRLMPRNTVWMLREGTGKQTTSTIHDDCAEELKDAAEAVAASGHDIEVLRAWIQVSGGGTFGLAPLFYPANEQGTVDVVSRL